MRVKCLGQEHNTMSLARAPALTAHSDSSALTMRPPRFPRNIKNQCISETHMLAKLNDFLTEEKVRANHLSAAFINTIIELKLLANVFVCLLNITYEVNSKFQNETPKVITRLICIL